MAAGLYDPAYEHDACGVGMVADLNGRPDHDIVDRGLTVLERLAHRGASGAEVDTGDGAGILTQIPHRFLAGAAEAAGFTLPDAGGYAVGLVFLPTDPDDAHKARRVVAEMAAEEGLGVLGWRVVPTEPAGLGKTARGAMPLIEQVFVAPAGPGVDTMALERRAFVLRKRVEHAVDGLYFPSLSARTLVYKGMLTSEQLRQFFPDLRDPTFESGLVLVHSRFSTNTFPSWPLAHPYRYLCHNGEINTLAGNRNWMRAREALLETSLIEGDLSRVYPICTPGASDSASFDEVLELLHLGGRSLPHAVLMMIPEAWENHTTMDRDRRAFYRYHASLMEPWDGPAAVCFTDGTVVGAVLDRNGLRPARYWVTDDGLVVLASEVGVLDIAPERVVRKGRLQPGRMFLVDTSKGRLVEDEEIKAELAAEHPYEEWLAADQVRLEDLPARTMLTPQHGGVVTQQRLFGYTNEELRVIVAPMARTGAEPIGSMGSDTSIAVLSQRSRLLYDYFTQLFAQVTNPPLDAIREELVTSLAATIGPEANLLEARCGTCRQILLPLPVIDRDDLAKLMYVNEHGETPGFKAFAIDGLFEVREAGTAGAPTAAGGEALRRAIEEVRRRVSEAIADGANLIVLSDRNATADWAPIPSLLLTAAIHHHLVREKTRTKVGLVIETGDAREVHHMALLIGLRRGRGEPVPGARLHRRHDLGGVARGRVAPPGAAQLHEGRVQGRAQGDVQDGHLHRRLLHGRPGLRGDRPRRGADRRVLHRDLVARRRRRAVGARRRGGDTPPGRARASPDRAGPSRARGGRRVPVAPRGRIPPLQPQDRLQAAARHTLEALRDLQGVHRRRRRSGRAVGDAARLAAHEAGARRADPALGGRADLGHHGPLLHRRHVLRIHLRRGAPDAGHRHEPHRRPLEHGGGRRGRRPLHTRRQRRPAPQRDQAGGLRAVSG